MCNFIFLSYVDRPLSARFVPRKTRKRHYVYEARHSRTVQDVCGGLGAPALAGHAWRNALRSVFSSLRDENLCIIRARTYRGRVSQGMISLPMGAPSCSIPKEKYPREVSSARNLTLPDDQAFRRLATMMQALAR